MGDPARVAQVRCHSAALRQPPVDVGVVWVSHSEFTRNCPFRRIGVSRVGLRKR